MTKQSKKLPSSARVAMDLLWGGWDACAIAAAVELDVFTIIEAGKTTAAEVAAAASGNENMMRHLLDTIVAMKYLTRKGDRYGLTPESATFLARGSNLYMEGAGPFAFGRIGGWLRLAEAIRSGGPMSPPGGPAERTAFYAMLVKVIFTAGYVVAREGIARMAAGERARIKSVLDVAAGAGPWSIPFAQANKTTRVTAVDFPEVTAVTREYATKFGVAGQYDYLEGNLRELDFGKDRYDLVILGHVVHVEGREYGRRLIERSAEALRKRGMLLIAEFIPNDDRTGPLLPMLFGLNMSLNVPDGDVFTMKEYRSWLTGAGLKTIKTIKTASAPSPLILATK